MFDIFAKALSSVASFLFPLFASYKALKTSDPAQLTPWLMYWVVFACALLVESWTEWFLVWIPFYAYIRLLFLLYLVLPQTQGARLMYQNYVHPWLEENEAHIDDFIASAHDRLRATGIAYLKRAIELLRTNVLGLPPGEPAAAASAAPAAAAGTQTYTQALLARFSLPGARTTSADFYSLLAGAVSAATAAAATASTAAKGGGDELIPPTVRASERASFIATQRERLATLLAALEREAAQIEDQEKARRSSSSGSGGSGSRPDSMSLDRDGAPRFGNPWGAGPVAGTAAADMLDRPASGLSKSRSEADFEKIDAESGAEDVDGGVRRRSPGSGAAGGGTWMPWGWGGDAKSTGMEK